MHKTPERPAKHCNSHKVFMVKFLVSPVHTSGETRGKQINTHGYQTAGPAKRLACSAIRMNQKALGGPRSTKVGQRQKRARPLSSVATGCGRRRSAHWTALTTLCPEPRETTPNCTHSRVGFV